MNLPSVTRSPAGRGSYLSGAHELWGVTGGASANDTQHEASAMVKASLLTSSSQPHRSPAPPFAALEIATREGQGVCKNRHRHQEFLYERLLRGRDRIPAEQDNGPAGNDRL